MAPLLQINSGDDFINPPELGIAEREITRVKGGRFVLLPASKETHGHGTHTWAAVWQCSDLAQLLDASKPLESGMGSQPSPGFMVPLTVEPVARRRSR